MQFMGDQSKPRDKDKMDLLYELLKVSEQEAGGGAGRPEAAFLSSFLGLHGLSLPLVTMHSNRPEAELGGMGRRQETWNERAGVAS